MINASVKGMDMAKKTKITKSQQRSMRSQQIVMGALGLIVALSMIISLIAK
jgi:hypothetical protein